ncbi:MAG: hypothetical protein ACOC3J_06825 [Gemmatimonadota bacterium]
MSVPPLLSSSLAVVLVLAAASAVRAQRVDVSLIHEGRIVPLETDARDLAAGRALAHALLATARSDATRSVTDREIDGLARRGTLLRVRLDRPEDVLLLRLGQRTRVSRLAAYVPPDHDRYAYVFLGRADWHRVIVVDLPGELRRELRRLRGVR